MTKHKLLYMLKWGFTCAVIKILFWVAIVFAVRQLHNFLEFPMPRFSWYWHPSWATTPVFFLITVAWSLIEYNPTKSLELWRKS